MKIITVFLIIGNFTYAGSSEKSFEEMKDTVQKVDSLNIARSGPNSVNYDCQQCITEVEYLEALALDAEEVSLERVLFSKGTKDNTFTIQRTKDSPEKVTIKFKEKVRVCMKTIAHKNPLSGQIGFSCRNSIYELRDESIEIDFSDRELKSDSEFIKVRLVKLDSRNKGFINASFKDESGRGITSSESGTFLFFGTKYNLE